MKRMTGLIGIAGACLLCGCTAKSGEMDVERSEITLTENSYKEELTVVVGLERIEDCEACAWEIVEKCLDNSFEGVRFSYDINGYPSMIEAEVYTEGNDEPEFIMTYGTDTPGCNVKDDPEVCVMEIVGIEEGERGWR